MQVKIMKESNPLTLERLVNEFIVNKAVDDIKYSTVYIPPSVIYTCLIMYQETRLKNLHTKDVKAE